MGGGGGSRSGWDFLLKVMHGGQGRRQTHMERGSACWVTPGPCPGPPLTYAEALGLAPGAPQCRCVCSHLHAVGCASPQANEGDLGLCGVHGQLCRGRQPWVPGPPLLPGGWAQAVGCPWSHRGAVTPSGSGVADMSEGLPFKHLAHYDHLAMPPGPSWGQSRPLSPLPCIIGKRRAREGQGGARGHIARQDSSPDPFLPEPGPRCPTYRSLGCCPRPDSEPRTSSGRQGRGSAGTASSPQTPSPG